MMKLYFSPGACSFASHIALNESGLKYESTQVNLKDKPADFVAMNPKGYIPALMTDKGLLTEGCAILQYIADQAPEKNLIPKAGTWERYKAIETLNFIATELHKGFSPLFGASRMVANAEGAAQLTAYATTNLHKRFDNISAQLGHGPFLMGNHFTVCDAYLFTVLNWTRRMNMDMSKWPKLMGFMETVQQRPSVQAAMKSEGI